MGFGKMNKFLEIKSIQNIKDDEGFSTKQEVIIAKVRGYREGRHGSEKWANRTTFTEATDLFVIRAIPNVKLDTDMVIICDDEILEYVEFGQDKVLTYTVSGEHIYSVKILCENAELEIDGTREIQ